MKTFKYVSSRDFLKRKSFEETVSELLNEGYQIINTAPAFHTTSVEVVIFLVKEEE